MRLHKPAAILFAMTVGLTGCISGIFSGMTKELREHGVSAEATILKVWDTGWTVNDGPVIGMRVEVRPSDGPAFEATIKKTLISRIDIPQFQPGTVVPVRFDPKDRTVVAVDFGGQAAAGKSGNPYHDNFVAAPPGNTFLPPPSALRVYHGTSSNVADEVALMENGYAALGMSVVEGGSDLTQAVAQAKEIGAAVVVVYGRFDRPPGVTVSALPFSPLSLEANGPGAPATDAQTDKNIVSKLTATEQLAFYLGKAQPLIFGAGMRSLNDQEKAVLKRRDGAVIMAVIGGSPAAAAHIQRDDIIVAIDGKPVVDATDVPALLRSAAGRKVSIDLLRAGAPLSVTAQLNPVAP
jgi:PDZ domain